MGRRCSVGTSRRFLRTWSSALGEKRIGERVVVVDESTRPIEERLPVTAHGIPQGFVVDDGLLGFAGVVVVIDEKCEGFVPAIDLLEKPSRAAGGPTPSERLEFGVLRQGNQFVDGGRVLVVKKAGTRVKKLCPCPVSRGDTASVFFEQFLILLRGCGVVLVA